MNLQTHHKNTYDELADEYEERVEKLRPVTREAVEVFSRYITSGKNVLDIGCAVGLAVEELNKLGYEITGIDISPKMINYARKRNPESRFYINDFMSKEFNETYDGILCFAFIHLFPKAEAIKVMEKVYKIMNKDGTIYIGTTKAQDSEEGFRVKDDYGKSLTRYRKNWTKEELKHTLSDFKFRKCHYKEFTDPYGKTWMDFICKK